MSRQLKRNSDEAKGVRPPSNFQETPYDTRTTRSSDRRLCSIFCLSLCAQAFDYGTAEVA
jgi:hypothetical protein